MLEKISKMSEHKGQVPKEIPSNDIEGKSLLKSGENNSPKGKEAKWLNNKDEIVEDVFGFNENSELVNGRAAMIGFLMLILTELVFNGAPVTHSIFAIN